MKQEKLNYFRPKARHIFTIGKDLIKDDFSALIELVKNAYDADATKAEINFEKDEDNKSLKIVISDNWNGMTEEDIRTKWLVPSTSNKLDQRKSPKWRIMQGQKWIWRYAASVLWDKMILESVDKKWNKTILNINWDDFKSDKFLDEVELDIKTEKTNEKSWVKISIFWEEEKLKIWSDKQISRLLNELSQLVSPFEKENNNEEKFEIYVNWEKVNLFQSIDFYDYKIEWEFKREEKKVIFKYINADKYKNWSWEEKSEFNINIEDCYFSDNIFREIPGDFKFDFLVIDRDPIPEREEVSKKMWNIRTITRWKAKKEFDKHNWVKLYRWWFRIRPYWDENDDWLWLNSRRVNSPTIRLSTNQVLWYIRVWDENTSWLEELTSRWWLKENEYFWWLKCIVGQILKILEERRYKYRKETWLWRSINKKLSYDELKSNIISTIDSVDIEWKELIVKNLSESVDKVFESVKVREKHLENILYLYERQATLWKVIAELIHEINQPLVYFNNKLKTLEKIVNNLDELTKYNENIVECKNIAVKYKENTSRILRFLSTISPLAVNKRKKDYYLLNEILDLSFDVFIQKLNELNIEKIINIKDYKIYCDKTDLIVAFSNFIDNSIYWLNTISKNNKYIKVQTKEIDNDLYIIFEDNGPWLVKEKIKDDIFDLWITLKEKWSWYGLTIAWDVLNRNDIFLSLLDSNKWFILQLIIKKWKK